MVIGEHCGDTGNHAGLTDAQEADDAEDQFTLGGLSHCGTGAGLSDLQV